MRRVALTKFAAFWLCLAVISPALAVQNNWTGGGGDMLWTNAANWSLGVLPDSTQDVFINNTGTNPVVLNAYAEAANFSLGSNAVLNLAGDLSLSNLLSSTEIAGTLNWLGGSFVGGGNTVITP